jgi:hypothetical protein
LIEWEGGTRKKIYLILEKEGGIDARFSVIETGRDGSVKIKGPSVLQYSLFLNF